MHLESGERRILCLREVSRDRLRQLRNQELNCKHLTRRSSSEGKYHSNTTLSCVQFHLACCWCRYTLLASRTWDSREHFVAEQQPLEVSFGGAAKSTRLPCYLSDCCPALPWKIAHCWCCCCCCCRVRIRTNFWTRESWESGPSAWLFVCCQDMMKSGIAGRYD